MSCPSSAGIERQTMEVDIACVGFGPAMGGFLTTLTQAWTCSPADPAFESRVAPGLPLQVHCYERADDLSAGVSGVVTSARGIRTSLPSLDPAEIPTATEVTSEQVFYLLDPIGASRRSGALRAADFFLRLGQKLLVKDQAFELPWTPQFLHKHGGLVFSIGQFNQWVASQVMASGLVQIWPGSPVRSPLFDESSDAEKLSVVGIRLADQGVNPDGSATEAFLPGMDVRAHLTVVGDGPVGHVGRALNQDEGRRDGRDWALGMKMVIELPEDSTLEPGTVWHTFGFPEPEIFGFMYVHPDRLVSVGIFVPSWLSDPGRTAYRYLQHYIQHPLLWKHLKDGSLRSWGAKSLEESGRRGEPALSGDGFARIGEGSGSTNMLTGSGVDEAWTTGAQLGEAVLELLRSGLPFTQENLHNTYEKRRRASWVDRGARTSEHARDGFHAGFLKGMVGMALTGLTNGRFSLKSAIPQPSEQFRPFAARGVTKLETKEIAARAAQENRPFHDEWMTARGWPDIPFDGRLLVSQQDALLMGGKVQAMPGFADHVRFVDASICKSCFDKTCIAMCSGQAIIMGADNVPRFEREKCVHCGACLWNCAHPPFGRTSNIKFSAGAGGLHSAEN